VNIAFGILLLICSKTLLAYDICDPLHAYNSLAKGKCYRLEQKLEQTGDEKFILSAVQLTKNEDLRSTQDNIILIPGGPGGDSQGLALSLNQKSIMDAMWAHLNLNVVLFDPRGTGNSQLNRSAEFYSQEVFTTSNQVKDLKLVIDAISPTRPVYLLAHSAGGNTAAKLASLYPNRVKGLILYSASIDTREIGESNLRIFSQEFKYWENYLLNQCDPQVTTTLKAKLSNIESFLRAVLKLQRLKKVRPNELQSDFYLKDFRVDLIKSIENDPSCNTKVLETLNKWHTKIITVSPKVTTLVNESKGLSYNNSTHRPPKVMRGTWIKTAVICSEGLTKNEFKSALWLDGLNFEDDTCFNVSPIYNQAPSREWLSSITAPTLLMGGTEDPYQIPSAVKRNADLIAGSNLLIFEGAGHEAHLSHPLQFFKALEAFILP
jgi:pimeloyl-ACP methyl ester carboxylesterase